jgi:CRISPR-associated protein Csy3
MTNLTMPTVLAFDRHLEPSDALMWSGSWSDSTDQKKWEKIELFERRNRAVKSNFKQEILEDTKKLQEEIAEANLSWGDDAALSHEHDSLKVSFSLRIVSGIDKPSVCNKPDFEKAYKAKLADYLNDDLDELAKRYAYNIANARFLWRNRIDAQNIMVRVSHESLDTPIEFDAYQYSLRETTSTDAKVTELANLIKSGLLGQEKVLLIIEAVAQLGFGQRVWPSQEMVLNSPKGEKSRHLFHFINDGKRFAAMHCEKIGNALRTIDDWYSDFETVQSPIAIEAYGSVTQRGVAYRSNKTDFKTLMLKWLNDKGIKDEEKHFVVAMLIRGGVFGEGES